MKLNLCYFVCLTLRAKSRDVFLKVKITEQFLQK